MNTVDKPNVRKVELTVVFWDIRGFSKICNFLISSPIPESIVEFLNDFYVQVMQVVSEHKGKVNKFMGDGVMAIFGLKDRDNDDDTSHHANNALDAAIELRRPFFSPSLGSTWLSKRVTEWRKKIPQTIDIGLKCGIHTGEVIVAEVGTEEYDYFGPVVNYASRFVGLAKDNEILVSQTTQMAVGDGRWFQSKSVKTLQNEKSFGDVEHCYLLLSEHNPFKPKAST